MSKEQEIIKQLIDDGDVDTLSSKENLEKKLLECGCSQEGIDEAMAEFKGFPLDDDDLMAIVGGMSTFSAATKGDPVKTIHS